MEKAMGIWHQEKKLPFYVHTLEKMIFSQGGGWVESREVDSKNVVTILSQ